MEPSWGSPRGAEVKLARASAGSHGPGGRTRTVPAPQEAREQRHLRQRRGCPTCWQTLSEQKWAAAVMC